MSIGTSLVISLVTFLVILQKDSNLTLGKVCASLDLFNFMRVHILLGVSFGIRTIFTM
jgi:hypothetical protein